MEREQTNYIIDDLTKKMVFIVGPRQVGKTWLAKKIGEAYKQSVYLNYDSLADRNIIQAEKWLNSTELLILDELHKMPGWNNYLKGLFDTKPVHLKIIVTGSARMDILRKKGDSLAGRYFTHHLLPFSPKELEKTSYAGQIDRFIERGGFPEPFLTADNTDAKRWRQEYINDLIRIDVLTIENIHDLHSLQLLVQLLQTKVGTPISYEALARDVGVSSNTIKRYIQVLENLYIIFRVTPFSNDIARSLLKMSKFYFYDTALVECDESIRFENFVAICLLKHVYALCDYDGDSWELQYIRTKERLEVDFCLCMGKSIRQLIEVKYSQETVSKNLIKFQKSFNTSAVQVVKELKREREEGGIEVRLAESFLLGLRL